MALDKVIDSTKLNASLTAEANAIRAKSGDSAQIAFDYANSKGFADAIAAIPSGGGDPWKKFDELFSADSTKPKGIVDGIKYIKKDRMSCAPGVFTSGSKQMTMSMIEFFSCKEFDPYYSYLEAPSFRIAVNIKYIRIPHRDNIMNNSMGVTGNLKSLVIVDVDSISPMQNTNALSSSGIAKGTGFVWVKDSLASSYKAATNWVNYAAQIKGYSESPVYSASAEYSIGDVCQYNGKFYGYCKEDLTSAIGQAPSGTTADNAYWEYVDDIEVNV